MSRTYFLAGNSTFIYKKNSVFLICIGKETKQKIIYIYSSSVKTFKSFIDAVTTLQRFKHYVYFVFVCLQLYMRLIKSVLRHCSLSLSVSLAFSHFILSISLLLLLFTLSIFSSDLIFSVSLFFTLFFFAQSLSNNINKLATELHTKVIEVQLCIAAAAAFNSNTRFSVVHGSVCEQYIFVCCCCCYHCAHLCCATYWREANIE